MHEDLLELAKKVGAEAAALLMDRPPAFEIEEKSTAIDIATQMDKKAETFIVQSLLAARPDDGILGEEGAEVASKSGITWVIDPLDGTVNYFYGLPGWNVSIAAKDKDGSVVGVVTAPTINSTWWASRGGGAFFNGSKIKTNEPVAFDRAFIGTGFQYDVAHRGRQIENVGRMLPVIRDIRRNGAAAVDICSVAMGALDAYFEDGLKEWDWAAASLVATEAGANFGLYGQAPYMTTLAAGPTLYAELEGFLNLHA
ncbi:SuhB Archaeal fructose-1,6-bisphosphatase and related enzymes of inositol monophosphatase family [Candidatus Nanopelagicaceae bacterium]|uniref:inositol-phosphate phosphatase n=1 Tax=freshwater metagenome TaxID=449393 RepID=A0A6J7U629_9ZZZZ|nr:inositol monophosphatase [Actinomycetota bacterium]